MADNKHSHYGHRSRLRERVQKEGLDNFQDYQVLEYALTFVIPYKDTNPIAHSLISKFGSLMGVLEADEEELKKVNGMGDVSANFLTSLVRIFNFYQRQKSTKSAVLNNAPQTYAFVSSNFSDKMVEEVYLISLTNSNRVLKVEKVGEGSLTNVKVSIRKITDAISKNKINKIILAHNHPNSDSEPSQDDDDFTKALVTTLAINDCTLVDHIILGTNGEGDYYSYRRSGKIDKYVMQVEGIISGKSIPPINYDYFSTFEEENNEEE